MVWNSERLKQHTRYFGTGLEGPSQLCSSRATRQIKIFAHGISPGPRLLWSHAEVGHAGMGQYLSPAPWACLILFGSVLFHETSGYHIPVPVNVSTLLSPHWVLVVLPAFSKAYLSSRVYVKTHRAFKCCWTPNYLTQWLTKHAVLHVPLWENIYQPLSVLFGHLCLSNTERLVLNKSRQPLLANNLKPIFSNAKERKFCIWGATWDAGWSQPAWDMYVWDDTALELGQAQLGAGSQYPRAGKALNCPWFAFHFQDETLAQRFLAWVQWCLVSVAASQRSRKVSWSQNKPTKPHFQYWFSSWRSPRGLVVSFWLGKGWKPLRLLVAFFQPSSHILWGAADRFWSVGQSAQTFLKLRIPFRSAAVPHRALQRFGGRKRNRHQHLPEGRLILCLWPLLRHFRLVGDD